MGSSRLFLLPSDEVLTDFVAYWKSTQSQSQSQSNAVKMHLQAQPPDKTSLGRHRKKATIADSDEEVVGQFAPRKGKPPSKAAQSRTTSTSGVTTARVRQREKSQP